MTADPLVAVVTFRPYTPSSDHGVLVGTTLGRIWDQSRQSALGHGRNAAVCDSRRAPAGTATFPPVGYTLENAVFQWEEGERRLREAEDARRATLERASELVVDEIRQRLGSRFSLEELSELYAGPIDWASEAARRTFAGTESSWVVDAAFARYAREASDYGGRSSPSPRYAVGD